LILIPGAIGQRSHATLTPGEQRILV